MRRRLQLWGLGSLGRIGLALLLVSSVLITSLPGATAANPVTTDTSLVSQTALKFEGTLLHPTDLNKSLHLAFSLYGQDEAGLNQFLQDLYNPNSASYHQFLTTAEYDGRFGPSQAARSEVATYLKGQGLSVIDSGTGTLIDADGTVAQIQKALGVQINDYQANDGRVFYSNNLTPALPVAISNRVRTVAGLSSRVLAKPSYVKAKDAEANGQKSQVNPQTATGCAAGTNPLNLGYAPNQIRTAYNFDGLYSAGYTGAGQTVAVYELSEYLDSDITTYEQCFGIPSIPIERVKVDGGPTYSDYTYTAGGAVEVVLDMEIILGLNPGLTKMKVYQGPNGADSYYLDTYQRIATDNEAKVTSTSWGLGEPDNDQPSTYGEDAIFRQMAAQGQSLFSAAGDTGDYGCNRDGNPATADLKCALDPASQPYVTGVGGTTLTINPATNAYVSEKVWGGPGQVCQLTGAGGGGPSVVWAKQPWQTSTLLGSTGLPADGRRDTPDVTGNADPTSAYTVYSGAPSPQGLGGYGGVGGTSAAAPLWAANAILVNQYLLAHSKSRLGFANPVLYQLYNTGTIATPAGGLRDITTGNNACNDMNTGLTGGGYNAVPGYDEASGIGSFNALALAQSLTALTRNPNPRSLAASAGNLNFKASVGGSNPTAQSVTLTSTGGPTNYTTNTVYGMGASNWLALTNGSGSITSGGSANLGFGVTTGSLQTGIYTATVTVVDGADSSDNVPIAVTFVVGQPLVANPTNILFQGVAGMPNSATPVSQTVVLADTSAADNPTSNNINFATQVSYGAGASGWLTFTAQLGEFGAVSKSSTASVLLTATVGSLPAGTYTATLTFLDGYTSADKTSTVVTLNVVAPGQTVPPTTLTPSPTTVGTTIAVTTRTVPPPTTGTPAPTPTPNGTFTYYLPFLARNYAPGGNITGTFTTFLAFQNVGTTTANVQVQYYNQQGGQLVSSTVVTTVAQYGEAITPNPFGDGSRGAGIITSNQPLNVIVAEATPYGGSAYAVTQGASTTLNAPFAFNGMFGFTTQLNVFNAGAATTNVTVKFYDTSGNSPAGSTKLFSVGPKQTMTLDQTASGSNIGSSFDGWAQMVGDPGSQLVAQVLEQSPGTGFVAIANAQNNPTTNTIYAPAIFNNAYGSFVTGASIINPNSNPITVSISYYTISGTLVPAQNLTLAPMAKGSVYQGSNTGGPGLPTGGMPANFTGAAIVQAIGTGGVLMAVNEYGGLTAGGTAKSGTYLAAAAGSSNVGLPVIANGGFGYITGDTVFNTTNMTVTATIKYINFNDGSSQTSPVFSIAPYSSQPIYQGDGSLPANFYGTAVVQAQSGPTNALIVTTNALSSNFFYSFTEPSQ